MAGRGYGHGLHQAIEAKEKVEVQCESKTLATITFQNYFRLCGKLAGMTGTAQTEEEEFESIYRLRTIVIPTHRPMIRSDRSDAIYKTVAAKFKAVAAIAAEKYQKGQPVLIGTTSIEKSEVMSLLLDQQKIPHQVLNAKQHEKEAEIVAKAGQRGAVTIATNMAGRGTDIKLGAGVKDLGGLVILGTERHEARRIDNQLRGRSGRQGDPGESLFFISMEDDLMRLFGGDRLKAMMERLKVPDDMPLENRMVSRSIEGAQKKVEGRNFDIRRHVLQYDDVMNKHRDIIYKRRQKVLEKIVESESDQRSAVSDQSVAMSWPLHEEILQELQREVASIIDLHAPGDDTDEWNEQEMFETLAALHSPFRDVMPLEKIQSFHEREALKDFAAQVVLDYYAQKCAEAESDGVARAESLITLRSIDTHWMDHIDDMSHLREQVAFSGFAQRDPLIEYQDQGFRRFQELLATINSTIVRTLLQSDFAQFGSVQMVEMMREEQSNLQTNEAQIEGGLISTGIDKSQFAAPAAGQAANVVSDAALNVTRVQAPPSPPPASRPPKVGRNDPCPCGSGKKYKKCHGKDA